MSRALANLSEDKRKEYRRAFDEFDTDKSNSIEKEELGDVLRSLGKNATEEEIDFFMSEFDSDGNGKLDFAEFVTMMMKYEEEKEMEREISEAFKMFDRDGNGYIDAEELQYTLTMLGEPLTENEMKQLMERVDINGDGKIDLSEFHRLMLQSDGMPSLM